MHHAAHLPFPLRADGRDEAVAANRDDLFARSAFARVALGLAPEELAERGEDHGALLLDLAPGSLQFRAGVVVQFARGKNLSAQLPQQVVKIGDAVGLASEMLEAGPRRDQRP